LVTPVMVFPFLMKSVLELDVHGVPVGFLSTADLQGYEDSIQLATTGVGLPFPYGFNVIADDVPL